MLMFPPDVTSTPVAVDNNTSALAGFSDNVGDMLLGSGIKWCSLLDTCILRR